MRDDRTVQRPIGPGPGGTAPPPSGQNLGQQWSPGQHPPPVSTSQVMAIPMGQQQPLHHPQHPQQSGMQAPVPHVVIAPKPSIKPAAPKKSWTAGFLGTVAKAVVLAVLAGGLYGGYTLYQRRQPYEWSGSVEMRTVSVGSRIGGRVKSVLVREGQQVSPGDVLVVLEPGALQAQRMIAEADVQSAQAVTAKLENGARPEEVAQAMAKLAAA